MNHRPTKIVDISVARIENAFDLAGGQVEAEQFCGLAGAGDEADRFCAGRNFRQAKVVGLEIDESGLVERVCRSVRGFGADEGAHGHEGEDGEQAEMTQDHVQNDREVTALARARPR